MVNIGDTGSTLPFFSGILLIGLIDNLIPASENPHEIHSEAETMPLHNPTAPLPVFDLSATTSSKKAVASIITPSSIKSYYGPVSLQHWQLPYIIFPKVLLHSLLPYKTQALVLLSL